jgi:phosphoglycolate phosphatase-like HAD superfamily hydrolase
MDMRLILFDIDGTLIHGNRAGRAAMSNALHEVFGTTGPIEDYDMAGKTDRQIVSDLLTAAGIASSTIEAARLRVYHLMAEHGERLFPEHGIRPCPGVPALLAALRRRKDVLLGLLTGNISQTAPLKLLAAGIDPGQFAVGAYGSESEDRNQLPALAMQRAQARTGMAISGAETIVVGDTPADIVCARRSGACAIAVATGTHSASVLGSYRPDYLLPDLSDTAHVLEILVQPARETTHE